MKVIRLVWQDIWSLKATEDAKCVALNKVTIFAIKKEIDRINISDSMGVVATMIEQVPDTRLKSPSDDTKIYQAYDALIFYRQKKDVPVDKKLGAPVFKEPEKPTTNIPTVDLSDVKV